MELFKVESEQLFDELIGQISGVFANDAGRQTARKYLRSLLNSSIERKNGWQIAENMGAKTPYSLQQFLSRGRFSADALRDVLRTYVVEKIGLSDGVLVVSETSFLKQGKKSCGVARQYDVYTGKMANCQVGIFLTYTSNKGRAPIDRQLYIPKEWCNDEQRRFVTAIPDELIFQTKAQIALNMLKMATNATVATKTGQVPYKWVTGDCTCGDNQSLREWLEAQGKGYVFCVSDAECILQGSKQVYVGDFIRNLPVEGWFEAAFGVDIENVRMYDWLCVELSQSKSGEFVYSILVRRNKEDIDDLQAYLCYSPIGVSAEELVQIAGVYLTVTKRFIKFKTLLGFDQYEGRSYEGWHKHITFACLAFALLALELVYASFMNTKPEQVCGSRSHSLDAFKRKRGLRLKYHVDV